MGLAFLRGVGGNGGGSATLQEKTVALDIASGDQVVTPDAGFDGISRAVVQKPASAIPENIKKNVIIGGIPGTFEGTAIPNDLDDLVDGTITSFTMPEGKTKIRSYLFDGNTDLTSINLQATQEIGAYAFRNVKNASVTLPSTLVNIGDYAFYEFGSSTKLIPEINCSSPCSVGNNAFNASSIQKVKGKFSSIGGNGFTSCAQLIEIDIDECSSVGDSGLGGNTNVNLTKLHININGTVGNSAFNNLRYIRDLKISGNISGTSLGDGAFRYIGTNRPNPSTYILTIDLRDSSFTRVGSLTFAGQTNTRCKYMSIYFPATVTSLNTSVRYIDDSKIYFTSPVPPQITANDFANSTNIEIYVPYNKANAYRTATNWAAKASLIQGWSPKGEFQVGDVVPAISKEGYGLSFYRVENGTTITLPAGSVITAQDAEYDWLCTVGTTILAYPIKSVLTTDCSVSISDGINTYQEGDVVLVGTNVTISASPTNPSIPYIYTFTINGTDYQPSDTQSFTMNAELNILAMYWDQVNLPIHPILSENGWGQIQRACKEDKIPSTWKIGDTKTGSDGVAWMLVDLKEGRYERVDGTGYTRAVFLKNAPYSSTSYWDSYLADDYSQSDVFDKLAQGGAFYNIEDAGLTSILDSNKIIIKCSTNSSSVQNAQVGLFIPSCLEVGHSYGNGDGRETEQGGIIFGAFEYFEDDSSNKRKLTNSNWWLRSRTTSSYAGYIDASGNIAQMYQQTNYSVRPCVAF